MFNSIEQPKVRRNVPKYDRNDDTIINADVPDDWDWRNNTEFNMILPVKLQGQCMNSALFAGLTVLDGSLQKAKKLTTVAPLSVQ